MSTYAAFVDFEKAFDWVDRDLLFYKLASQFGLGGKLYNAIKSLYDQPTARVKINERYTETFHITSGVKQGDNLSPTLFAMYLNDLAVEVKSFNCGIDIDGRQVTILLYADDIVLLAPNESSLQKQLDAIYNWCRKWLMKVNTKDEKTEIVHFRPKGTPLTKSTFYYGSYELKILQCYKYLGTYIDENLSFAEHSDAIAAAGSRALGRIRHKLYYLKECRSATFTKLYSSCICPILDYWAAIWGDKEFIKIEQVQLRALRYFLGVHRFAPTPMLLGDAGWMTCHSRHELAALRLWNRLVTLPSTRLTSAVFLWDLSFGNKSNTWCNNVGNIFQEIGLPDLYASLEPCDIENCYKLLIEKETVKWNVTRYNKPKLRLYNMFKSDFVQEPYITFNVPKFQRSLFAQFRTGILPLHIETGRFVSKPLNERICCLCPNDDVEDEVHFLTNCSLYDPYRVAMYKQACRINPEFPLYDNLDKFVFLVNDMQLETLKYVYKACQLRRNTMYKR